MAAVGVVAAGAVAAGAAVGHRLITATGIAAAGETAARSGVVFGVGALSSFGLSSALGSYGYGYASPAYGYSSMGVYNYLPTWGVSNFAGWGLGSVASNWAYSGYTNPYYATVIAAQPAQTNVVYDYSQPINVTSPPPDASVAESNEQVFSAARDSFKAGDYQRALDLTDQVLKQTPNEAVVHEFRALCLFALKRYDEAASVNYAVLTAGPGWNWSTMVGLYPDVDTYTNQLRALEAYARSNPSSASGAVFAGVSISGSREHRGGGHDVRSRGPASAQRPALGVVRQALQKGRGAEDGTGRAVGSTGRRRTARAGVRREPRPARPTGSGRPHSTGDGSRPSKPPAQAATTTEQPELPPPPPAKLVGSWKAQASPDVSIMSDASRRRSVWLGG